MRLTFPALLYALAWFLYLRSPDILWWNAILMCTAITIGWWWMLVRARVLVSLLLYGIGVFLFAQILVNPDLLYAFVLSSLVLYVVLLELLFRSERARTQSHETAADGDSLGETTHLEVTAVVSYGHAILFLAYFFFVTAILGFIYFGGLRQEGGLLAIFLGSFLFGLTLLDFFTEEPPLSLSRLLQSLLIGFVVAQISWIIQFTPLTYLSQGAIVLTAYFAGIRIAQLALAQQLHARQLFWIVGFCIGISVSIFILTIRVIPALHL
ncbi:MAG: hypothetical protein HY460_00285 [Parcubacteria group bacterium]|nr:hypothetical protein [Parcubacteria group bacterium]